MPTFKNYIWVLVMTSDTNNKKAILEVSDLQVYYGSAHVIQGINLTLTEGILSVVGRNGMGKTTLCKSIMGLLPAREGSIRFDGHEIIGKAPHTIANLGIGYVPQGRRLWRSLSVNEHLKLVRRKSASKWDVDSIYQLFPRLAERQKHKSSQLSGGEQQMLAIARALLASPRLLIMDEPTEGLAPAIVRQLEKVIGDLIANGNMAVLMIEQNIGVATRMSEFTAIMINGQIGHLMPSIELANDHQLQQKLIGVSGQS